MPQLQSGMNSLSNWDAYVMGLVTINPEQSRIFFSKVSSYKGERLTRTNGLLTRVVSEIQTQLIERSLPEEDFRIYMAGEPDGHNTTTREIYTSLRAAVENSWLFVGFFQPEYFRNPYCIAELLFYWDIKLSDRGAQSLQLLKLLIEDYTLPADINIHIDKVLNDLVSHSLIFNADRVRAVVHENICGASHTFHSGDTRVFRGLEGIRAENYCKELSQTIISMSSGRTRGAPRRVIPAVVHAETHRSVETIRLGIVPLMSNAGGFRKKFQSELAGICERGHSRGFTIEVFPVTDYRDAIERLVDKNLSNEERLHAAFLGPGAYDEAIRRDETLVPVATRGGPDERVYHWLMIGRRRDWHSSDEANADNPVFTDCRDLAVALTDLNSPRNSNRFQIAFSDQDSTSGFVKPNRFLSRAIGIGLHDWASVVFCRSHDLTFFWMSGRAVRQSMTVDGYSADVFPPQLKSFPGATGVDEPRVAMIDSDVFSLLKGSYPDNSEDELRVIWKSPCSEHQYPWVARNITLRSVHKIDEKVPDVIKDVLLRVNDSEVLKAFAAKSFLAVENGIHMKQFVESRNSGMNCEEEFQRLRCGVCQSCRR